MTLVDRLVERMLYRLANGQWSSGQALPPTRRLEDEFNVSHGTMLAAVRRLAAEGLVEVRQRRPLLVMDGAAELARDLIATTASLPERRRLAILVPEFYESWEKVPFYNDVVRAVTAQGRRRDVAVEPMVIPVADQVAFSRDLANRGFGAAMIIGHRPEYSMTPYVLKQAHFPTLLLNRELEEIALPSILMDEYGAGWRLAERLVALGHRDMCFLYAGTPRRGRIGRWRVDGWLDCLEQSGVARTCQDPVHALLLRGPNPNLRFGTVWDRAKRPTAIVFSFGYLCELFIEQEAHRNIRVPQELSVATLDTISSRHARMWCGPVTHAAANVKRIAECTIEMVERMLAGDLAQESIRVPMDLVETDSIGPPPSSRGAE